MNETNPTSGGKLIRALGPATATAVIVGTVIGSGVFKKPQDIAENVEYFGITAAVWIVGGILTFLGALSLAEVSVLYPRAGGNYVYLREGYGRAAGFLWGWVEFWIIRAASLAALASVFSESFNVLIGSPLSYWPLQGVTIAVLLSLALVNVCGVKWGGGLQLVITVVKVGSLAAILLAPFLFLLLVPHDLEGRPTLDRLRPTWPDHGLGWKELSGVGTAFLGVLWAYHGWMNLAPVAEEVRNPQRNIPLALLCGVGIVIFLYLGANLAYSLVLPRADMQTMKDPPVVTEFTKRLLGPAGTAVASLVVMCSVFGALNGNLLVGPRLLYAMGEDGLAPKVLSAVHPRFHTPVPAILVLAIWACLLVLGVAGVKTIPARYKVTRATLDQVREQELSEETLTAVRNIEGQEFSDEDTLRKQLGTDLEKEEVDKAVGFARVFDLGLKKKDIFNTLTNFAMFGAVIFETMAVVSIFVFRRKYPEAERPYRCWGYPVVPALYVLLPAALLANMFFKQLFEAIVGTLFIGMGMLVYVLVYRQKAAAEPPR